jgi:hypothetical protein
MTFTAGGINALIKVSFSARRMSEMIAKYAGKVTVLLEAAEMSDVGEWLA